MSYVVRAVDVHNLSINETDTATSVLQNVAVIISTLKGSVPLYRDFGISPDILDKPLNVAKALLLSDVIGAVEKYEPRVNVKSVDFEFDKDIPGKLIPTVEVELNE